jgi:hypothetical protein
MSADTLLFLLSKVKRTKPNSWLACCPAHDDRSPSLTVTELADGRVLIHCFAGCDANEVLGAVGLDMTDLFPANNNQHFTKGERRPFVTADIFRAVASEVMIVYLSGNAMTKGETLSDVDMQRLLQATSRIQSALKAGGIANV